MVQLNRRWAPHRSQDNPPCMISPPLTLPLYIPFLYSRTIRYFYNGTAQLPLGFPLVTDNPSPILTPTLNFILG